MLLFSGDINHRQYSKASPAVAPALPAQVTRYESQVVALPIPFGITVYVMYRGVGMSVCFRLLFPGFSTSLLHFNPNLGDCHDHHFRQSL